MKYCSGLFILWLLFCCEKKKVTIIGGKYKIKQIATLDKEIDESSGIIPADEKDLFWTHNDGDCKWLFKINKLGEIVYKAEMPGNFSDIEDIAKDENGYLYIGDFGNNANIRKGLVIYKYDPAKNVFTDTIRFRYPDQHDFPPPIENMNFDCEAMIFYNDSLYLFSKNKGGKVAKIYILPSKHGKYVARLADKITINSLITAADINPSKTRFVILTYEYLYLFGIEKGKISFSNLLECRKIKNGEQMEAVCFTSEDEMLITNEQRKVFEVKRKK